LATKERRDLSAAYHRAAFTASFSAAEGMFEGLADAMYDRLTDPKSWTPCPDAKPTLGSLHQHGVRVGVVSNIGFDIRPIFSYYGLSDLVAAFALSYEHGIIKPDPALFELAMRALDVGPAETVMVGDNVADSGAVLAGDRVYLLPPVVPGTEQGSQRFSLSVRHHLGRESRSHSDRCLELGLGSSPTVGQQPNVMTQRAESRAGPSSLVTKTAHSLRSCCKRSSSSRLPSRPH